MSEASAYIGLGSNLGDRLDYLVQAVAHLEGIGTVVTLSSIYETAPWGYQDQPSFLNAVCQLRTGLPPERLLEALQRIEGVLDREREQHWGPRTIDLDVLLYDSLTWDSADLTIPHPYLHERAFVLVPLAEIAPQQRHPRLDTTVAQLLAELPDREGVQKWGPAALLR